MLRKKNYLSVIKPYTGHAMSLGHILLKALYKVQTAL